MHPFPKLILAANHWHFDVFGGAYKLASELALYCSQKGYSVYYVSAVSKKGASLPADQSGAHWYKYSLPEASGRGKSFSNFIAHILRSRGQVKRILKEFKNDQAIVINGHSGLQYIGALLGAGRRPNVRRVVSVHSPMAAEYKAERAGFGKNLKYFLVFYLLRMTERICYRRSDIIQCDSEYTRRLLENEFPKEASGRTVVCPGYVDLKRFNQLNEAKASLRKKLKNPVWDTPEPIFFCLRRLVPRMGIDRLIEAAAWLRARISGKTGFKVIIGGEGPLQESLKKLAQSLRLEGVVCFLGRVSEEELPFHYQAADCFVLPTRELECFGLPILESFACGTPVIATPVGAIPEVLGPFSKVSLTEGIDPESIGKAMLKFLKSEAPSREDLARYASRFNSEKILAQLSSIVMGRDL